VTSTHEDFHAIVNIAIAYTWALDTKNFDALNDVFAPDATGMLNGVHCDSRDAIIARISEIAYHSPSCFTIAYFRGKN
jgi:hypothetical protein